MATHLIILFHFILAIITISHILLHKRESNSALNWILFIALYPFLGVITYYFFGINRVKLKVLKSLKKARKLKIPLLTKVALPKQYAPIRKTYLQQIEKIVDQLTTTHLLAGNNFKIYKNGEETYSAMLKAINNASSSINMCSYIFDNNEIGYQFLDALTNAKAKGVKIHIFIDAVGSHYSFPSIVKHFKKNNINIQLFNPTLLPWKTKYLNLRNHKKILIVDGKIGFTGGMNISKSSLTLLKQKNHIQDIHFKIEGPTVRHLQETFVRDWAYITGENLTENILFPSLEVAGNVPARGISDGPDEKEYKLRDTILGALSCARSTVLIQTPYFLPDSILLAALKSISLRGVKVKILIPEKNNSRLTQWAAMAQLWQVLDWCEVYLGQPPFDHSKYMVIDDYWCFIGSANWDQRSLRLNYEFNVECYSTKLAKELKDIFTEKIHKAKQIHLALVETRPMLIKLRDGLAHLATPFL